MKSRTKSVARLLPVISLWAIAVQPLFAAVAIWAKGGVSLPVGCEESTNVQDVPSPDGTASVEVRCAGLSPNRDGVLLHIRRRNRPPVDVPIERPPGSYWRPQEILWAPDSTAFVVNGSESAYAGDDFVVYRIADTHVTSARITAAAQHDMVTAYPPCKAAGLDSGECARLASEPEFNMSVIAWTRGSTALVVFAEVPCSSTYGGIMCQVMGYELEVRTGRILVRIPPRELKRRYQSQMAWPMRIPERPSYK